MASVGSDDENAPATAIPLAPPRRTPGDRYRGTGKTAPLYRSRWQLTH
jgi:hypothetical protein